MGVPCNQFGNQEPFDAENPNELIAFLDDKDWGVSAAVDFLLMTKYEVNGAGAHPLYRWAKSQLKSTLGTSIKWNFTHFVFNAKGEPVRRYGPPRKPSSMAPLIQELLTDPAVIPGSFAAAGATSSSMA